MIPELDELYWNNRYASDDARWDVGEITRPLKVYIDQLTDKELRILIPGCGNAWEAEYLWRQGFRNVFVIDIAPLAVEQFKKRLPDFPAAQIFCEDFFTHTATYHLILEQTFFCALNPSLREAYALQIARLLAGGGRLVGLLFTDFLNVDKPPFGGTVEEYEGYFKKEFRFHAWARAYNSIDSRAGREWFLNLRKV
ncbi:MAG: methyltransferase domain-containing protein [Bacteroidia bacterium]